MVYRRRKKYSALETKLQYEGWIIFLFTDVPESSDFYFITTFSDNNIKNVCIKSYALAPEYYFGFL